MCCSSFYPIRSRSSSSLHASSSDPGERRRKKETRKKKSLSPSSSFYQKLLQNKRISSPFVRSFFATFLFYFIFFLKGKHKNKVETTFMLRGGELASLYTQSLLCSSRRRRRVRNGWRIARIIHLMFFQLPPPTDV
jgi:hypothetical protein